ncbi:MAG: hypothetical protein J0I34_29045 [Pseudonocardia sp.]|uniref:hypothetical protein n=1 Tax=unclassified Pseudonocardia TaxID=2619320 RepID=UPI001AC7A101|nr:MULTISPECIES: hypothetical protein [unclassified Pseudonocardia]MBN9112821.1 hypothetical protein [Pseudonocardia sp.]
MPLLCPVCGTVLADGTYRRFPPNLTLRATDGSVLLQPTASRGPSSGSGRQPWTRHSLV